MGSKIYPASGRPMITAPSWLPSARAPSELTSGWSGKVDQASTTGQPPIGRSRTLTMRRPWASARIPQPHSDHGGRGLDRELPLTTHDLRGEDLKAVQAQTAP